MARKKKSSNDLFGKRSLRSYVRQTAGALSELPIFENKYYDLFKTPLDTFQEYFPEGTSSGWRSETKGREDEWYDVSSETLYDLWRKTGAPQLETRDYNRPMTAPREFGFADDPNKLQKGLGYLFGAPRLIFPENPMGKMGKAKELIAELSHQIMFENPDKYGSKKEQIAEMQGSGVGGRKGMSRDKEIGAYYDNPKSAEYVAHSEIEPRILDWIRDKWKGFPED